MTSRTQEPADVAEPCLEAGGSPCGAAIQADLGWALGNVFRQYVRAADWAVADLPGAHRGFQVLSVVARDLPRTQLALAAALGLDRTVMTYLIDDLAKAGLVERQQDPADRRARRVVVTDSGRTRLAQLEARLREAEAHTLAALPTADQATFRTLLRTLATAVEEPAGNACTAAEELAGAAEARRSS